MAIEMFKRGSVEMLALLILNEDDAHGYRIVQEIKDRSDGRLIIKEGSLYPILYKLSDEGYIISQEDISETKLGRKRIRVIYSITPKGREHLIQLRKNTISYMTAFAAFLKGAKVFNYEYRYRSIYS